MKYPAVPASWATMAQHTKAPSFLLFFCLQAEGKPGKAGAVVAPGEAGGGG